MSNPIDVTLHTMGAETATGQGSSVDLVSTLRTTARLGLNILAVSGTATPTLTVTIQTSPDSTNWQDVMAFPAITAVWKTYLFPGNLDRYIRARWVISGTNPSFRFSLTGQGHVIYADRQDLIDLGIPASALSNVSLSSQYRALLSASGVADVHLNRVFTLPLSRWDESLRRICAAIAAFDLRRVKGFKPEGIDQLIKYSYEDAILSLRMMEDQTKPPDIVDATPDTFDAGVIIYSSSSRGW